MAIKQRVYLASVNNFKEPTKVEGKAAIGIMIVQLFLMEPGSDPLHPDMGIGIKNYRYTMDTLSKLENRINNQIETYIPDFQNSNINLIVMPDKSVNVEISSDDVTYVYDSSQAPVPIILDDIKNN